MSHRRSDRDKALCHVGLSSFSGKLLLPPIQENEGLASEALPPLPWAPRSRCHGLVCGRRQVRDRQVRWQVGWGRGVQEAVA